MALNFFSTRSNFLETGVKVLVYGPAGVGKTRILSTAEAPVIFSAEAGLLSLAEFDLTAVKIESIQDLIDAYNWILESAEAKQYKTVALDSITEVAETVLSEAKSKTRDMRVAYGELLEIMIKFVKKFRDLPEKDVYFSAKETWQEDLSQKKLYLHPAMPGAKLGPGLAYYFDLVLHMEIGQTEESEKFRFLRTSGDGNCVAKDRSAILNEIEKPDLKYLFDKIKTELQKRGD